MRGRHRQALQQARPGLTAFTGGHVAGLRSTFNASLNRNEPSQLAHELSTPDNVQAQNVAETIQRIRPDVLLINKFDYAPAAVEAFRANYVEMSHHGSTPIDYPYAYIAPSNTGVASGFDLNDNGVVGDARHPGGWRRLGSASSGG